MKGVFAMPDINLNIIINVVLIAATIIAIIVVLTKSRLHTRKKEQLHKQFIDQEAEANAVRKKEIDPELYFVPDLSELPAVPEGDPNRVERSSKRPMIYFRTPKTNLELKREYGPAQMDILAQHEENFNEYLKCLTSWATELSATGEPQDTSDALLILGYAIAHGAEFRNTYKITADIYAKAGEKSTLEALYDMAKNNHFRDPAIRQHILEHIQRHIANLGA